MNKKTLQFGILQSEKVEKIATIKKALEDKFGIIASVPDVIDDMNLGVELKELQNIKEYLDSNTEDIQNDVFENSKKGKKKEAIQMKAINVFLSDIKISLVPIVSLIVFMALAYFVSNTLPDKLKSAILQFIKAPF